MNDAATFEPAEAAHPDNDADRGTVKTTIDIAASPERARVHMACKRGRARHYNCEI